MVSEPSLDYRAEQFLCTGRLVPRAGGQQPSSAAILGLQRPLEEVALGRLLVPIAISCHVLSFLGSMSFHQVSPLSAVIFSHLPPAGYFPSGWFFFHSPCLALTSLDPASPSASLSPSGGASPMRCPLCLIPWPQGFGVPSLAPLGWLWVGCEVSVACCLLDLCALFGLNPTRPVCSISPCCCLSSRSLCPLGILVKLSFCSSS